MKAVLQRVSSASVQVDGNIVGSISAGLLVLLGIKKEDADTDAESLAQRCSVLRVFADDQGKMNLSVRDMGGQILVVSQFTLYGDTRKGTRPSYSNAAPPDEAERLYDLFVAQLKDLLGAEKVRTGVFGAMMQVSLVNDGPVTVMVETPPGGASPS